MRYDNEFKKCIRNADKAQSRFIFVSDNKLPKSINTPMCINFVYVGSEVLLTLDKEGLWGPVYLNLGQEKAWKESVMEETQKRTGVSIKHIRSVGYVHCVNSNSSWSVDDTIFPVYYSFADFIYSSWKSRTVKGREIFSGQDVKDRLENKDDGDFISDIYEYIHSVVKEKVTYTFEYIPDVILPNIPVTSAMVFCYDNQKKFCVVRDKGEDFLSLPGGKCGIDEGPGRCVVRELFEEAIIYPKNKEVLGTILVSFFQGGKEVAKMQQLRYVCQIERMEDFSVEGNEFETDLRTFIELEELPIKVKQLRNDTGKCILKHLKTKLNS